MENLVVTTPGFLAVLAFLAVVATAICALRWRRGRRWMAALLSTVPITLGLLTAADFVNAHYDYAPQVRDVLDVAFPGFEYRTLTMHDITNGMAHPHGGVVDVRLPASQDGFGASHELVYVPKAYFTTSTALPVVYLLHGSPGSAEDWFRAAHAASVGAAVSAQGTPAILVAPEMSRGWTQDSECVDGTKVQAESHLLQVVLPATQRLFRVSTNRSDQVIAGNSAGGYCALNIGLRHRDEFATIIDLSGYTHPTYSGGLGHLFGDGPTLNQMVAANSPDRYAQALPPGPPTRVWLDVGRADRESFDQETALIRSLNPTSAVTATLTVRKGGHSYQTWRPALRDALGWALRSDSPLPPGAGTDL